jgi:hypothetical protein
MGLIGWLWFSDWWGKWVYSGWVWIFVLSEEEGVLGWFQEFHSRRNISWESAGDLPPLAQPTIWILEKKPWRK